MNAAAALYLKRIYEETSQSDDLNSPDCFPTYEEGANYFGRRILESALALGGGELSLDDFPTYEEGMTYFNRRILEDAISAGGGELAAARRQLEMDKASFCRMRRLCGLREMSAQDDFGLQGGASASTIDCGPAGRALFASSRMLAVREDLSQAAKTPGSVLIKGTAGSGKSILARAFAALDEAYRGPLIADSCFDVDMPILEECLFGRGSEPGMLEEASGGTLVLEEIECLSGRALEKFARMLKTGFYERTGGGERLRCNARIIAAFSFDAASLMKADCKIPELLRLFDKKISLSPFGPRPEEILPLAEEFLRREGAADCRLSDEAQGKLLGKKYEAGAHSLERIVLAALEEADEARSKLITAEMIEDDSPGVD